MSLLTAKEATNLCSDWCDAVTTFDRRFGTVLESNELRLPTYSVDYPKLTFDETIASLTNLSRVLFMPNSSVIILQDHALLWSWCGESLLGSLGRPFKLEHPPKYPDEDQDFDQLFETVLHAALASALMDPFLERRAPIKVRDWMKILLPHHAKEYLHDSITAFSYLAFPLLEATLKRACKEYVARDSKVRKEFTVPRPSSGRSETYKVDRRCNRLADLLYCHYDYVADPDLKQHVDDLTENLKAIDENDSAFDLVGSWRNQCLHGQELAKAVGGIVLNLCLLILLWDIRERYDELRSNIVEDLEQQKMLGWGRLTYYRPIRDPLAERDVSELSDEIFRVDVEARVLQNPEEYFGTRGASAESIATSITSEALTLGVRRTLVTEQRGWWYICGDLDWLRAPPLDRLSIEAIFSKGWGSRADGDRPRFRPEVLAHVFSDHLFSVSEGNVHRVKGDEPSDQTIEDTARDLGDWKRVIGFHFDPRTDAIASFRKYR